MQIFYGSAELMNYLHISERRTSYFMGSGLEQQKPATNTFPKPFIEECKFLETCGFTFEDDNEQKKEMMEWK